MSPTEVAHLTGYAPGTIHSYLAGRRLPSRLFLLDLLDKVPLADLDFNRISPLINIKRGEFPNPLRYHRKPLGEYLAAVRIFTRRTRDQLAAKLRVTSQRVFDVEHGVIPDQEYLLRLCRALPTYITLEGLAAAFPVLRPTPLDIKIKSSLEKIRLFSAQDPRRARLENDLAAELIPEAKRMALSAAWKVRRPEFADEVWGEAIALAIRHQDPNRGLFLSYLGVRIRGLIQSLVRAQMQSGSVTILSDYGGAVREAEEVLSVQFGRTPSDQETARYLDISPGLVAEVKRAASACVRVHSDDLDFLLQHAVDVGGTEEAITPSGFTKTLQDMPDEWREIVYLHFHDRLLVAEIAVMTELPPDTVQTILDHALRMLRGDPDLD